MPKRSRRSFLVKSSAAAGTVVGLTGCLGGGGNASSGGSGGNASSGGSGGNASSGGGGGNPIQLGAINPLSGSAAAFGKLATKTQTAWANQVNKSGGLEIGGKSREVNIVEYDDESSNTEARSAAQRLATVDNVSMILSSWRSNGAIAINEIINNNQIPTFTHGFTPEVNTKGGYMMRLTVSTVMDAYPALQFVSNTDNINTIGVIAEEGDWGEDTLALMDWWFNEDGNDGKFKNLGRFPFGQQDFSSYITSARNANIDALYVQTWAAAMQRFINQQDRAGLNNEMPILTGLGGADYNSLDEVGASMENVYALGVYTRLSYADNEEIAATISDKALSQFEDYQSMDTPNHPTAYNVYADCQAAEYALTQAGSTKGTDLQNALLGNDFTTILGNVSMPKTGQPSIPGALIKFAGNNGKAVVDSVPWADQLPSIINIPPQGGI